LIHYIIINNHSSMKLLKIVLAMTFLFSTTPGPEGHGGSTGGFTKGNGGSAGGRTIADGGTGGGVTLDDGGGNGGSSGGRSLGDGGTGGSSGGLA
jgi:hypothetical protein